MKAIYDEGELSDEATCKSCSQVRREGGREVSRTLRHYNLDAILAVGYRVRSHRGTTFRQWATARLRDYLVTGFAMDDERLKNPPGPGQEDYFGQLLARIRDIRSSERVFWRKVLDIYATSIDYDPSAAASQAFFATVQNKMHWAAHGHTAAEIVHQRADAALGPGVNSSKSDIRCFEDSREKRSLAPQSMARPAGRTAIRRARGCTAGGREIIVSFGDKGLVWRLRRAMPADFFREAKVAAG